MSCLEKPTSWKKPVKEAYIIVTIISTSKK